MRNYQTKSNDGGGADSITATNHGAGEYNSIAVELEGVCTSAGLTLAAADGTAEVTTQLAQAMSIYGAGGAAYHIDTGVANAYVLNPVSPRQSPLAYFDGFTVSFVPGNKNTGSSTVNIAGLGVKSIRNQTGQLLTGGELHGRGYVTMRYSSSSGIFLVTSTGRDEISYSSVALLRAGTRTPINGQVVFLHGYYSNGDGGGQTLVWYLSSSATDNGVTVFKGTGIATGRYLSVDTSAVYAKRAGVKADGSTNDSATLQNAIDVAQDLDVFLELPANGQIICDSAVTSKQGKDTAGTGLRYRCLVHGNGCTIKTNFNGDNWTIVPYCTYAASSTGDGDGYIEMTDINFDGNTGGAGAASRALVVGKDGYWIGGFNTCKIENVTANFYTSVPFKFISLTKFDINRLVTGPAALGSAGGATCGGVVFETGDGGFVGGITMRNCEVVGTATLRPISIVTTATAGTSEARGITIKDCDIYGSGVLLNPVANGQVGDVWIEGNTWDGPTFKSGETALNITTTGTGILRQIFVEGNYYNNAYGGGLLTAVINSATGTMDAIKLAGNRYSRTTSAGVDLVQINGENVTIRDNEFFGNTTTNEIGIVDGCNHIVIQNNNSTSLSTTNFINISAGGGTDNITATGNTSAGAVTVNDLTGAITKYIGVDNFNMTS